MRSNERGVAAVECACVGLIFFVIIFGIIEVARLLYTFNTLHEVARRTARIAVVNSPSYASQARSDAIFADSSGNSSLLKKLSTSNVTVTYVGNNPTQTVTNIEDMRFVRVVVSGVAHDFLVPVLAKSYTLPDIVEVIPRESLGQV